MNQIYENGFTNILDKLDREQKGELARLLHRELNVPDLNLVGGKVGNDRPVRCPYYEACDIYGHGTYKGRSRYKCRSCSRTFNDFTGTAVDGIKKPEQFQEYLLMVVESITIRKAATEIGVNMKTIFDWRYKLLSSLEALNGTGFSKISTNMTYIPPNFPTSSWPEYSGLKKWQITRRMPVQKTLPM